MEKIMNWHETVEHFRKEPAFKQLVNEVYLSEDLNLNVESFRKSAEFTETLKLLYSFKISKGCTLLDVGAGNGISSIAFAVEGFKVTALEPDLSDSVGAGAIARLKETYGLPDIAIDTSFGEEMPFPDNSFDIIYARQCMHHAFDLQQFTKSIYRVTKPGGVLITTRDHVITDETDKQAFLKRHPLHKFYGGENAFTLGQYSGAITGAGFKIKEIIGPADSVINYSPWNIDRVKTMLKQKLGGWAANTLFTNLAWRMIKYRLSKLPGRLYSFVAEK